MSEPTAPLRETLVLRVPTRDPGDVSGLEAQFDSGAIAPDGVAAMFGKTAGNAASTRRRLARFAVTGIS